MAEPKYLIVEHLSTKDIIRIFSKIAVDPVTGCWNWIASCNTGGYGHVGYGKRGHSILVHRLLYAWLVESIPKGSRVAQLDHKICDNKRCCNPAHLLLGTPRTNVLRGSCPAAINARKLLCIHGHLLDGRTKTGTRYCKTCTRLSNHTPEHRERARDCMRRKRAQSAIRHEE